MAFRKDLDCAIAAKLLEGVVKEHEQIVGPCTMQDMINRALAQVGDLVTRCHGRIEHLSRLKGIQPGVKSLMRERANALSWSAEQESEYAERLLTRIPDALAQRFLLSRVSTAVLGIDADERNLAGLIAAEKALLSLSMN